MDSPAQLAAARLAWDVESWRSVEILVATRIKRHDSGGLSAPAFDRFEERYIETSAGMRYGEFRGLNSTTLVSRAEHFANGSKFASINYDRKNLDSQASVVISRQYFLEDRNDRKQIPPPLLYLYVGREPLQKALSKAQYLGHEEIIGRKCDVFLFEGVRWATTRDQVFYLDGSTAIPLKVESFRDKQARENHAPLSVWTARSLEKIQNHHVARSSGLAEFGPDGKPVLSWDIEVASIQFDKEYPPSTFWPTIQPGVTILDSVTGKVSEAPGAKKAVPAREERFASTSPPVRAEPPSDWSSLGSSVSLGLGCAILALGGVLWWRRQ